MNHATDTEYARFRRGIANALLIGLGAIAIIAAYLANK